MEKLKVCDYNHLLLYAKNWYERDEEVEDVRKIIAHRAGTKSDNISDTTLWDVLIHAFLKYAEPGDVEHFMKEMFKGSLCGFDRSCSLERAVGIILGVLSTLQVKAWDSDEITLDIGTPDPNVLPLKKD